MVEVADSCIHAARVRIIGVYYQGVLSAADHLGTVVCRDIFFYRLCSLSVRHSEILAYGQGCHHVVCVIVPYQVSVYHCPFFFQCNPQIWMAFAGWQYFRPLIAQSVRDQLQVRTFFRHPAQVGIIGVDESLVCCPLYVVVQFAFCLLYALKAAESEQMGLADIGDQTEIRKAHRYQFLYVTGMTGSHFDDSYLCPVVYFQE